MGLQLITPADELPVTLAEAKSYLRIPADDDSEDADIAGLIAFATEHFQAETGQTLGESIYRLTLDSFPCVPRCISTWETFYRTRQIILPALPLISVETVKYLSGGSLATFDASNYTVDVTAKPGRIALKSSASWPAADVDPNAVLIDFTAGYAAGSIPERAKQAIKWLVGHAYENREIVAVGTIVTEIPLTIKTLIQSMKFAEYVA